MNLTNKIKNNKYFLVFILLFAYAQSIHSRLSNGGELNFYTFTPDAAISTLITTSILIWLLTLFISRWQKLEIINFTELLKIFGSSLLSYLVIVQLMSLAVAFIFGNVERNFNSETFLRSTFSYLMDGFIYGSFFLLYYYYKKSRRQQEQLIYYNQAIYESRLTQLKSQLNPHFLFNNLNVLDQLIYEDKTKASNFLTEFSEIYRYVLQASTQTTVSIKDELAFALQYFNLMKHKFGDSYQLTISGKNSEDYIVPLTLQLLIENAVKHNLGTVDKPIRIEIEIDECVSVSNNIILKRNLDKKSGTGLKNLNEQYKMLTGNSITIIKNTNQFSVIVPIVEKR